MPHNKTTYNFRTMRHLLTGTTAIIGCAFLAHTAHAQTVISGTVNTTQTLSNGEELEVTLSGVVSNAEPAVDVNGVTADSITNSGTIQGTTNGILLTNTADIQNGISNTGSIIGGDVGINVQTSSDIAGGINNTGSITSGSTAILIGAASDISGNIDNSGNITGLVNGIALVSTAAMSGNINNSGTITSVSLTTSEILGVVTNQTGGLIERVEISGSDISGSLVNEDTGIINEIIIDNSSNVTGNIDNQASITGAAIGISIDNATVSGDVTNSGTISGSNTAIKLVTTSDMNGGLTNTGTISGSTAGIVLDNSDMSGGIDNSGTINANSIGIGVDNGSDMTGTIDNSGTISAAAGVGIAVNSASGIDGSNDGNVAIENTSSGTISGLIGVSVTANGDISGAFLNDGTISGNSYGLYVDESDISGTISNTGTISGDTGYRIQDSTLTGILDNTGTISGDTTGILVTETADVQGTITNTGTISTTGGAAIQVESSSDISGGILNQTGGTISGVTGILVDTASISGGISLSGGTITGTGGTAIDLNGLTGATPITLSGGSIVGDVIDDTPGNGFSDVTVSGDFQTQGDFSVSDVIINPSATLTIRGGDSFTINDMTASTGTLSFGVASGATGGVLNVSAGDIDLTGATVAINLTANISDGAEILIGDGSTQVTGLAGGAGQTAVDVTDNSLLWNFQIADGSQAEVTGSTDNTQLYAIASQNTSISDAANERYGEMSLVVESLLLSSDPEITGLINNLSAASTDTALNEVLESAAPSVDTVGVSAAAGLTNTTLDIAAQQIAGARKWSRSTGFASGNRPYKRYSHDQLFRKTPFNRRHNRQADHPRNLRTWGQVFGSSANHDTRSGIDGYDADTYGFALGMDRKGLDENLIVGLALSFGSTDSESDDANRTQTDVKSYQITAYGDYTLDNDSYITGFLGFGFNDNDLVRNDVGGVSGLTAEADYNSFQYFGRLETGRHFEYGAYSITPNVMGHYMHYDAEEYDESGAGGLSLTDVDQESVDVFQIGGGLTVSKEIRQRDGNYTIPEVYATYKYDVIGDDIESSARFLGGGGAFSLSGATPSRHTYNMGAAITFTGNSDWEMRAAYDFEYKEDYKATSGYLRAAYSF